MLGDFPDGLAFARGAFLEFVFAFVGVRDEVADVGDVHDMLNLEPGSFESAAEGVVENGVAEIADVVVVVDGGAAGVEGDFARSLRAERFDVTAECVVELHGVYQYNPQKFE
jgi:hypothetical protein